MTDHGVQPDETERIRARSEKFQDVLEQALSDHLEPDAFLAQLREAGALPTEAEDYVGQFSQRRREAEAERNRNTRAGEVDADADHAPSREHTPEGLNEDEATAFRLQRDKLLGQAEAAESRAREDAVEAAAWKVLEAKLRRAAPSGPSQQKTVAIADLLRLYEGAGVSGGATSSSIPNSVLDIAPHLHDLSANAIRDPHLEATWKLRNAFMGKDVSDPIIDVLQSQSLTQALPRSIWKTILQDQYVDFEKLFASTEPGYDHNDDLKDFGDGYALVKKDQASAKKPLRTEADWIRVFSAWKVGVVLLYPHRQNELEGYERMVQDIFRASPQSPLVGIQFDVETRQRYAKSAFRMDDRNQSFLSILSQLFRTGSQGTKRPSDGPGPPKSKKHATICRNWNLGLCEEPCPNKRKHGVCSECAGRHPARESNSCYAQLQARFGKGTRTGGAEGSGSGGVRA